MTMTAKRLIGLDLSNGIQDAQIIASQTTLEALLIMVIKLCTKYTDAQKYFLLINENKQLQVKATLTGPLDKILVLQAISPQAATHFPQTIVNKTYKSNTILVLDYRLNQENFADDPYLAQYKPASICCIPIYFQAGKFGVLYLENTSDSLEFGVEDIQALQILLSHMAIWLKKIQLYTQPEQNNYYKLHVNPQLQVG